MPNSTVVKSMVITLAMSLSVGLALAADSKMSSSKLSSSDSGFIKEAAQGGMMEVELGKAAQDKASNEKVKDFGKRMGVQISERRDLLAQALTNVGGDVQLMQRFETDRKSVV